MRGRSTLMLAVALGAMEDSVEDVPVAWKRHHPDDTPKPVTAQDVERIAKAEAKRKRRRERGW